MHGHVCMQVWTMVRDFIQFKVYSSSWEVKENRCPQLSVIAHVVCSRSNRRSSLVSAGTQGWELSIYLEDADDLAGIRSVREENTLSRLLTSFFVFLTISTGSGMWGSSVWCHHHWRIQGGGGHWAIAQCLKIYCPVIFWDDTNGPVLRNMFN